MEEASSLMNLTVPYCARYISTRLSERRNQSKPLARSHSLLCCKGPISRSRG